MSHWHSSGHGSTAYLIQVSMNGDYEVYCPRGPVREWLLNEMKLMPDYKDDFRLSEKEYLMCLLRWKK
jgi:hypothetical protein